MSNIKTIIEFEEHADGFLPWDFALDEDNRVTGKSPYEGQKVLGFGPKGDLEADLIFTFQEGWQDKVTGLVPVLIENGNFYQLASHVVHQVREWKVVV